MENLDAEFELVRSIWQEAKWPGVEEDLSYGTPALKVRKKLIARLREPGVLVLRCSLDEKEFLMAAAPEIYFETDHYKGWPAVLVRLSEIGREELSERLEKTWRGLATKKQVSEFDSRSA